MIITGKLIYYFFWQTDAFTVLYFAGSLILEEMKVSVMIRKIGQSFQVFDHFSIGNHTGCRFTALEDAIPNFE